MGAAAGIALANHLDYRAAPRIHVANRAVAYRVATDLAKDG
jgi:hypothetical protein